MAVRELDGFTNFAVGGDCFINKSKQTKLRDKLTGQLRQERVFRIDHEVDLQWEGQYIEIGERGAEQLADVLGWIPPWKVADLEAQVADLTVQLAEANSLAVEATESARVARRELASVVIEEEAVRAALDESQATVREMTGRVGALTKQIKRLQKSDES